MGTVLVVDDDELMRLSLCERLQEAGHTALGAGTGSESVQLFEQGVDLVLLDYYLPDATGVEVAKKLQAIDAVPPIIFLTARASVERAVDSMKGGAYYYAQKMIGVDQILLLVENALEATRLSRTVRALLARERAAHGTENLIGVSDGILAVKALVRRVASRATTVLLSGETGTGKDLVARALHAEGDRAAAPFMNITCSALPESLLENELFGHEHGAFTDARRQKKGLLEQASGGTVFLDEIGDVSLGVQAKLLRFLEEKTFRRLGGSIDVCPDVRVIAATNRDLRRDVRAGTFREDLLYRLSVVEVELPPLRERTGDVPLLAGHFIERFNGELKTHVMGITPLALRKLEAHWWPGNVRELRNAIERAMLLYDCDELDAEHLKIGEPVRERQQRYELPADGVDFRVIERELVETALRRAQGNQSRAAALLHMSRDQMRHRMEKFKLLVLDDGAAPEVDRHD